MERIVSTSATSNIESSKNSTPTQFAAKNSSGRPHTAIRRAFNHRASGKLAAKPTAIHTSALGATWSATHGTDDNRQNT